MISMIKSIFKIHWRDVKAIFTNKIALVVFAGLVAIPSLYAWVNIGANWDPYAATGNIPIAVVNNDNGAFIDGEYVNVGDLIVAQLEEDQGMDWVITSDFEAGYGLHMASYYALIEIPDDFSSDLATFTTANIIRPEIIYRSNEKANAIATKITDVAKTHLTQSIQAQITQVATAKVFGYLNSFAGDLSNSKGQIFHLMDVLDQTESDLDQTAVLLQDQSANLERLESNLATNSTNIEAISSALEDLGNLVSSSQGVNTKAQGRIDVIESNLDADLAQLQTDFTSLELALANYRIATAATGDQAGSSLSEVVDQNATSIDDLTALMVDLAPGAGYLPQVEQQNFINTLETIASNLVALDTLIGTDENPAALVSQINQNINGLTDDYQLVVKPLFDLATGTSGVVSRTNFSTNSSFIGSLNTLANASVATTIDDLNRANELVASYQDSLEQLDEVLSPLDEATFDQVVDIMKTDPETISDFLANPINVETQDIYGTYPFGVGLTPFYTVLSIWVGILLTMALVTTKVKPLYPGLEGGYVGPHFGRMLTITWVSLLQTTIVLLGDLLLLDVPMANPVLFFGAGYFTALVFVAVIYTLVSLFGNVGKGICVVVMVFQIAGSGGIYPIQTNPEIFGVLHPLWPFTYAIDLLRQAIALPNKVQVVVDFQTLGIFMGVFLVLGLTKRIFYPLTSWLDHKFHEAQL